MDQWDSVVTAFDSHALHQGRVVGPVAHGRELLFAELALPASDLEGYHDPLNTHTRHITHRDEPTHPIQTRPVTPQSNGTGTHLTDLQLLNVRPDPLHLSHELVTQDVSLSEVEDLVVVQVKVGTADRGTCDLDDGVVLREP